uniref:Glycosylphosphatidylinositol anchor attachment 1 protein n=1 Tax=Syphacia muris TaxID=451379 RepID=A0A158R4S5_9BILA
MRSLSQSVGKPPRIISALVNNWKSVCILGPTIAVLILAFIILPGYNEPTRVSENALLPALVTENFAYQQRIIGFAKELNLQKDRNAYVARKLRKYGILPHYQRFQINLLPNTNATKSNVFGQIYASRSASVEAILVAVSIEDSIEAISTSLALATYCREQIYWARNLIFVFVDGGVIGMKAFLASYYGEEASGNFYYDHIDSQGGAIIGAFIIKTTGSSFRTLNIEYNMLNGQLPNLDLINLVVRLADKFDVIPTIYNSGRQYFWSDIAKTVAKGIFTQAFVSTEGLHSVFGSYGIQAVTIHAKGSTGHLTLGNLAKICEGMLRSLNNIIERFHQSYFLYILPNPRRFISVAYYMPIIGFMILPFIVLALREWTLMESLSLPNAFIIYHIIGLFCYIYGKFITEHLLSIGSYFHLIFLLVPYYKFLPRALEPNSSGKFFMFLELALVIGLKTPLVIFFSNFVFTLESAKSSMSYCLFFFSRLRWLREVLGFIVHPMVLFLLIRSQFLSQAETLTETLHSTANFIAYSYLFNDIGFHLLQICLIPLWSILLHYTSTSVV